MTTTAFPPSTGGVQGYLAELCAHFTRFTPEVVTLWLRNRTDWLRGSTVLLPETDGSEVAPGVRALGWSEATRARMAPWALLYYAMVPLAARRLARLMEPGLEAMVTAEHRILHNHRIGREFLALATLAVARRRGLPFALTPYHHPRWKGYRYLAWIDVYRSADALFALTAAEKEELVRLGVADAKVHVVGGAAEDPMPADPARFRQLIGSEAPIVLFLGQLYDYKGVRQLVEAAMTVRATGRKLELVFIGPHTDWSRRYLARQAKGWIHVLGRVDDQTKWDALAAAEVLCLPSAQESFGRVFLEAWAVGKPVIGGRIPSVSEIVEDGVNGLLVTPGSTGELFAALLRVLSDPELASRLGERGRQDVPRRFSWPLVAARVEAVYEELLSTSRPVRLG